MTMDFLSNIVHKMEQTQADLDLLTNKNEFIEKVIKVNPDDIGNWEFRDRQEFELGDIDALSESILSKGQAQPIIVVESNSLFKSSDDSMIKYIVIAGYRRWLACKSKNIPVDAIVRNLNFEQAVACLISENEKEKVSDYSKGVFYYNLLKKERVTKKALYEKLGINRGVFDNYLSFSEVPKEVWSAVRDMSNVSARTSSTIKSICQKGEREKRAIIAIADKIALGIGEKKINALVNKILSDDKCKANDNATRVAFTKNVFIDVKENSLVLTAKKIRNEDIHKLKEKFSEILENYFEENKQLTV
ncbi:TPA: ParB/RepB/Spo0J family partition protein [Legionella pneumophila]